MVKSIPASSVLDGVLRFRYVESQQTILTVDEKVFDVNSRVQPSGGEFSLIFPFQQFHEGDMAYKLNKREFSGSLNNSWQIEHLRLIEMGKHKGFVITGDLIFMADHDLRLRWQFAGKFTGPLPLAKVAEVLVCGGT